MKIFASIFLILGIISLITFICTGLWHILWLSAFCFLVGLVGWIAAENDKSKRDYRSHIYKHLHENLEK